ncbi:MAG: cytochrome c-type biogenesis protein CcmH [Candidatus Tokpelaia sp. JSC085]|nr:MAG: cytochrome c-type biogenesis protein CcmH [Candidatus Tokpelaia sp. JSC085]
MLLFFFLCLLSLIVTGLALIWVSRKPENPLEGDKNVSSGIYSDLMIFRNQMKEIEIEKEHGLFDNKSAAEARLELAHRVLTAEKRREREKKSKQRSLAFRFFLMSALLFIPLFSGAVYSLFGSPETPSYAFSMILARDSTMLNDAEKLVQIEVLANRRPWDAHLVDRLAGLYLAAGRFLDAVNTCTRAMIMHGESADRFFLYATALIGFEGGVVTQEAAGAFLEVIRLDPQNTDARTFLAHGLLQNGKITEAITLLEEFFQSIPENVAWRKNLAVSIANFRNGVFVEPHFQTPLLSSLPLKILQRIMPRPHPPSVLSFHQ